jgi:hypothetical protein
MQTTLAEQLEAIKEIIASYDRIIEKEEKHPNINSHYKEKRKALNDAYSTIAAVKMMEETKPD